MILYMDTSALIKRYVKEVGSAEVIKLWENAEAIAISKIGYAESIAGLYRKTRGDSSVAKSIKRAIHEFESDWISFMRIDLAEILNETIDELVEKYPLRGFDAIHLASALALRKRLKENLVFVCADVKLSQAAKGEGFTTYPE